VFDHVIYLLFVYIFAQIAGVASTAAAPSSPPSVSFLALYLRI